MSSVNIPQIPSALWRLIETKTGSWSAGATFDIRNIVLQGYYIIRIKVCSENLTVSPESGSSIIRFTVKASSQIIAHISGDKATYTMPKGRILCDRAMSIYPGYNPNGAIVGIYSNAPNIGGFGNSMQVQLGHDYGALNGNISIQLYGIK